MVPEPEDRPLQQFCATVLVGEDIRAVALRAAREGLIVHVSDDIGGYRPLRRDDPRPPWTRATARPSWFSLNVAGSDRAFTTLSLSCCARAGESARIAAVGPCST